MENVRLFSSPSECVQWLAGSCLYPVAIFRRRCAHFANSKDYSDVWSFLSKYDYLLLIALHQKIFGLKRRSPRHPPSLVLSWLDQSSDLNWFLQIRVKRLYICWFWYGPLSRTNSPPSDCLFLTGPNSIEIVTSDPFGYHATPDLHCGWIWYTKCSQCGERFSSRMFSRNICLWYGTWCTFIEKDNRRPCLIRHSCRSLHYMHVRILFYQEKQS